MLLGAMKRRLQRRRTKHQFKQPFVMKTVTVAPWASDIATRVNPPEFGELASRFVPGSLKRSSRSSDAHG